MFNVEVTFIQSPNYSRGRHNRRILAIVDHITAGSAEGALSWLCNPISKASAHYLVTRKGEIFQMVKDEDTAWHAGIVNKPDWTLYDGSNPNYYTVGIEHEALGGQALTEAQYQASLWLHRHIIEKYNIPADRDHIIGHYRIDSVNRQHDPGPGFSWERLFKDLADPASQYPAIKIKITKPEIHGLLINNQVYAPVRKLAEALEKEVEWHEDMRAVIIPPINTTIPAAPPGSVNIVTGSSIIPGVIYNNTSWVPVRPLAESLGRKVIWDNKKP
nr:N-acetylmuramoyl-L-alanine amidase [Syntrophomonas palmitatica]